jgi:hypothetical protein
MLLGEQTGFVLRRAQARDTVSVSHTANFMLLKNLRQGQPFHKRLPFLLSRTTLAVRFRIVDRSHVLPAPMDIDGAAR